MSNNKAKPAAGKSVAGKNNSKQNKAISEKERQKQKAIAEKNAKRLKEEKLKQQLERQKKSAEIQKRREVQSKREQKTHEKTEQKENRTKNRQKKIGALKGISKKIKYFTSKEFINSFNYVRIFVFIVLPIALIAVVGIFISNTVIVNVPVSIRSTDFSGRTESDAVSNKSTFNSQQQSVFMKAIKSKGSNKFSFYINSEIHIDDNNKTTDMCLGNPSENDCVIIATIFDSDGNVIYRSLGLNPDREINNAAMFAKLPYGTHDVKVCVNAYNAETYEKIGTRYAKIKLLVGVDADG
jgi:pyruvoyl-dependent arginine decarboxylase (PvlArgDC)